MELGVEDRVMDQTLAKRLDYAIETHRAASDETAAKLRSLEEQFGITSDLFYDKLHQGKLGDEEPFFSWDALVEIHRRIGQRLAVLLAESSA